MLGRSAENIPRKMKNKKGSEADVFREMGARGSVGFRVVCRGKMTLPVQDTPRVCVAEEIKYS